MPHGGGVVHLPRLTAGVTSVVVSGFSRTVDAVDAAISSGFGPQVFLAAASRNPSNNGRNSPVRQKFSGCHWTPRQKRAEGSSIASMTPSGAVAVTRNAGGDGLDRLMVPAVHLAGVVADQALAHQFRQERILVEPDLVREVVGLMLAARSGCDSCAPVICDGMSCTSVPPPATFRIWMPRQIANIGQIEAPRGGNQADLELVARRIHFDDAWMGRFAISRRRDVVAACQQQALDARQAPRRCGSTARGCGPRPRCGEWPAGSLRSSGTR